MTQEWKLAEPRQIELPGPVTGLRLDADCGAVEVIESDGPTRIDLVRLADPDTPVTVRQQGSTVTIGYHREDRAPVRLRDLPAAMQPEIRLLISVPIGAALDLNLAYGSLAVAGTCAPVRIRTAFADVTVADVDGPVTVEATTGSVTVERVRGRTEIELAKGDVKVVGDGPLKVDGALAAIETTVISTMPADLDLTSANGSITVSLPPGVDLDVLMTSRFGGEISCDFDEVAVTRRFGRRQLSGVLGTGRAKLRGSTTHGDLTLIRHPAPLYPALHAAGHGGYRPAQTLES